VDDEASAREKWLYLESLRDELDVLPFQRRHAKMYVPQPRGGSGLRPVKGCAWVLCWSAEWCCAMRMRRDDPDDPERIVVFDDVSTFVVPFETRESQVGLHILY
jgi:hypothetical protein